MRRLFAPAALAAVALALLPTLSFADDSDTPQPDNGLNPGIDDSATFDLGIDISGVTRTPAAVHAFIGTLPAASQSAVMGACETFMEHPESIQAPDTYAFCSNAVRG
jgi:hypothetical protein